MTKFLVFALALASAPAAVAAEETPHDSSRWQSAIDQFERQDARQSPPRGAVLFVGSSSIRRWDLPKYFPDTAVINRGFGGSQIADAVNFVDQLVLKHAPRVVVLYAGDNDVAAGKSPEKVHADFQAFVSKVREKLADTKIVFISIKPSRSRWEMRGRMQQANDLIAATCAADESLAFVDIWQPMLNAQDTPPPAELFADDGLHLSHEGYLLWAEQVQPQLAE